ncbi:MAG: DUF4157 domain-containing protein, partial [Myxococcales bacterium]|nr:DUF4157 domain-containing protein [Myxococcales bacterium]
MIDRTLEKQDGSATEMTPAASRGERRAAEGATEKKAAIGPLGPIQCKRERGGPDGAQGEDGAAQEAARAGVASASDPFPHAGRIQSSFGRFAVDGLRAQVGGPAVAATQQLGATAFAHDGAVAFRERPDLHTAAHEATHLLQQRNGRAPSGLDRSGELEGQADAVADRVVRGESAEDLLDRNLTPTSAARGASDAVQCKDDPKESGPKTTGEGARVESLEHKVEQQDKTIDQLKLALISQGLTNAENSQRGAIGAMDGADGGVTLLETSLNTLITQHADANAASGRSDAALDAFRKSDEKSKFDQAMDAILLLTSLTGGIVSVVEAGKEALRNANIVSGLEKHGPTLVASGKATPSGVAKTKAFASAKVAPNAQTAAKSTATVVDQGRQAPSKLGETKGKGAAISAQQAAKDQTDQLADVVFSRGKQDVTFKFQDVGKSLRSAKDNMDSSQHSLSETLASAGELSAEQGKRLMSLQLGYSVLLGRVVQVKQRLERIRQRWDAYLAAGPETMADKKERGLFEQVMEWKMQRDPKFEALRVLHTHEKKLVQFQGTNPTECAGYRAHKFDTVAKPP